MRRLKILLSKRAYPRPTCLLGSSQVPATPAGGTSDDYARVVDGKSLKGSTMNLRKIAVVGGFAVGAALTLAPLASADNTTDLTSAVSSEIASLNSTFTSDATLFGVGSDLIAPTAGQPFETISLLGAPDTGTPNAFDYFLYGLDPAANAKDDPGAYELF